MTQKKQSEFSCVVLVRKKIEAMASFVKPQFQAWGTDPMRGFGSNLTVVDKVPPHMMHLVDPYWYQFPPMNPLWHSILGFTIFMLGACDLTKPLFIHIPLEKLILSAFIY